MASFKNIRNLARLAVSNDDTVEKQLYGYGRPEEEFNITELFGGMQSSRSKHNLSAMVGTVYDCVNLLGERSQQYQIELHKVGKDGTKERVDDHPLIDLMRRPQPKRLGGISGIELFYMTRVYRDLCGEAFWLLEKGAQSDKIKNIVLLDPTTVGIKIDKNTGEVLSYFIRKNRGANIPLKLDEVWQFKRPNPQDPYHGLSVISAHSDEIATSDFATRFTRNFFKNNAGISGVLSVMGMVNKTVFQKFTQMWRQKYEGVDNAGRVAIMRDTDAKFTKVGVGLNELDMKALKTMNVESLLQAFRVPKELLGQAGGVGLGQQVVTALEFVFNKYVIDPEFDAYDSVIQQIADTYFPDDQLIVSHENIIPEDKVFNQTQEKEFVNVIYTINEIRKRHGLEDIDGGNQLYIPLNLVPIGEEPLPAKETKSISIKRIVKEQVSTDINTDKKEQFRLKLQKNQGQYERKFKKAIAPILKEQEAEVLNNLEALGKEYEQLHFDDAEADAKFIEKIHPIMLSLIATQGALALLFAGDDSKDFQTTAGITKAVDDSVARMARNFNDETLTAINKAIEEAKANSETVAEMKKRIESVYKDTKGYRAERIARTETLKASNYATNEAYKQTGYVTAQKWYTNPGACPLCDEMDGKTVGLDSSFIDQGATLEYTDADGNAKTFVADYETIETPPIHAQCRCTIIPVRD